VIEDRGGRGEVWFHTEEVDQAALEGEVHGPRPARGWHRDPERRQGEEQQRAGQRDSRTCREQADPERHPDRHPDQDRLQPDAEGPASLAQECRPFREVAHGRPDRRHPPRGRAAPIHLAEKRRVCLHEAAKDEESRSRRAGWARRGRDVAVLVEEAGGS
jgi:hypothetical protein